jgi:hypothetical protein
MPSQHLSVVCGRVDIVCTAINLMITNDKYVVISASKLYFIQLNDDQKR